MTIRHRGEEYTYRKMHLIDIFEPGFHESVLIKILKEFGKKYPGVIMRDWEIKDRGKTLLGQSYNMEVVFEYPYFFNIGCYRDGWHIDLKSRKEAHDHISINDRNVIFDDPNRDGGWTTENNFVAPMMIEIADKVIQELEQLTK